MALVPSGQIALGQQVMIHTLGAYSIGQESGRSVGSSSAASAAWPSANLAILVPFRLPAPLLVQRLFLLNGATASGNVDIGIYDVAGTRLLSTGSTAQSGTSAVQSVDVTDTPLAAGVFYLALATADPTEAATGASMNEVANAGSYARQSVTFGAPSNGVSTNSGAVTFPTATGTWGTVSHFVLVDSGTHGAGNVLFHGALTASKTVASGDSISFADGQLSVTLA